MSQQDVEVTDAEEVLDGAEDGQDADADASTQLSDLEQEGEIAADYLEGLLDIADLDGDIDMDVEGDRAVSIVSRRQRDLQKLVGRDGEVLEALQELTRLAVHRETGDRSRLMLDIGGYRARRRAELAELGAKAAEEVEAHRRAGEAGADDAVRAQGRARRGGRRRPAQRVRGRGAAARRSSSPGADGPDGQSAPLSTARGRACQPVY